MFFLHNATFIYRLFLIFLNSDYWQQGLILIAITGKGGSSEDLSWLKISPVFALNYLATLETVNFIISSLRETLVLARVGNRNFSSLSQYCGRCTYCLRRSWKRAKMPLNGHLRKPKTLLSPTVSLSFHEVEKALPMLLVHPPLSFLPLCFPYGNIFPQFFLPMIFVLQRNRERFPLTIFFCITVHRHGWPSRRCWG